MSAFDVAPSRRWLCACMFAALGALAFPGSARAQTPWSFAGADLADSRAVLSPTGPNQLNADTAKRLKVKWSFETAGDVSATPTVEPGGLYVTDWGKMIYKLDPTSGAVIWSHTIGYYTGDANSRSRSSPAIVGNVIYIGDLSVARVIAIDKNSGEKIWVNRVESNNDAFATMSPVVYNNILYFGIASREESLDHPPSGGFRGSVVALNAQTGAMLWKFITVPAGYTGGGVVAPPVVDAKRGLLYIAADNNYSLPSDVADCVAGVGSDKQAQLDCMDPTNYVDAIVALDLTSGALRWSRRFEGADTWTAACNQSSGCLQPPGTDNDFASAPNLFWVKNFIGKSDDRGGTSNSYILGIGSKSGMYRALNPDNGGIFWSTLVGLGGIQWGSTVDLGDHTKIYVALKNDAHFTNTITDYYGNSKSWRAGFWTALDAATGTSIWEIPAYGQDLVKNFPATAPGPVSFSNYVVFAGATSGYMTAISAKTGYILWTFQSGGTVVSAPAIFNDWVYWGTGYDRTGVGKHMLYAFSFQ